MILKRALYLYTETNTGETRTSNREIWHKYQLSGIKQTLENALLQIEYV